MTDKHDDHEIETTGHSWDGIQEYNNPLPRWWLWTFYATILWGLIYTIAYPAWPMISQATPGMLGFSTRAQVAEDIAANEAANADLTAKLASADMTQIAQDAELHGYAVSGGAAVFRTFCAQCHGSGAAGVQASGYPNLLDDDWLWGGDIEAILYTVRHGIRNEEDLDSRYSQMPAFGEWMEDRELDAVTSYVLTLSGQEADTTLAAEGTVLFEENCASCHADAGIGDREQGAPNLTDAIWLYGGDVDDIRTSIANARFGVMPNWSNRLTEAEIRAVSAYVHQLGGGE